jgi:hypothetical protein
MQIQRQTEGATGRKQWAGVLAMPALAGIALLGAAAAAAATFPSPATTMELRSQSGSAASMSVAAAMQYMPPLHRRDSSFTFYDRYHYVLLPSSDRSKGLATDLDAARLADTSLTIPIVGQVKQLDLGALAVKMGMTQELLARVIALAVETAQQYTRVPAERLRIRAIKLLTAQPGKGEQMIHCDHLSGFACRGRYSFLLYASAGAPSTAMWQHPRTNMPDMNSDESMRDAAPLRIFKQL